MVAFTFEPHPRGFFVPDTGPFRLTLLPAKTRLLAEHGAQAVLAQRFEAAFAALPASSFIEDVLLSGLGARHVVCGYDFTFGARRSGNVEMLRAEGARRGFGVTVVDPVTHEGEIYSSTRIREALRHGWAREAADLLGHSWEIEGTVELGDQRGRTIGFPTANLLSRQELLPANGVYAADTEVDGHTYRTIVNIGHRPTVDIAGAPVSIEAHLIGYSGDLYGHTLHLDMLRRLRDERRFGSVDALAAQLRADAACALGI